MLLDHKRKNINGNFQTQFFENDLREQIKKSATRYGIRKTETSFE